MTDQYSGDYCVTTDIEISMISMKYNNDNDVISIINGNEERNNQ